MKNLSYIFFISFFMLLTSSCSNIGKNDQVYIDKSVKQIVFFSDDSTYKEEAAYYDAIVELKKDFPKEFNNMLVLTGDAATKYCKIFKVDQLPAILISYQDEVLVKVKGKVTKEQITESFTNVLAQDKKTEITAQQIKSPLH